MYDIFAIEQHENQSHYWLKIALFSIIPNA